MRDPFEVFPLILASRATKAALALLVLGWLPLLLVIAFGDPDSNPIGLGLLAWLATALAVPLAGIGVFRGVRRWLIH
ncbi:MAG: hypothetical protein LC114_04120 [Bryobacterales bacterium]|nr:hypothetical protein [Bryobacterales bacterium]